MAVQTQNAPVQTCFEICNPICCQKACEAYLKFQPNLCLVISNPTYFEIRNPTRFQQACAAAEAFGARIESAQRTDDLVKAMRTKEYVSNSLGRGTAAVCTWMHTCF